MPEDPLKELADQFVGGGGVKAPVADKGGQAERTKADTADPLLGLANAFADSGHATSPVPDGSADFGQGDEIGERQPTQNEMFEALSEELVPGFKASQQKTGLVQGADERFSMALAANTGLVIQPETFRGKTAPELRQFADNAALATANQIVESFSRVELTTDQAQVGLPFNTEEGEFLVKLGLMPGLEPGRPGAPRPVATIEDPAQARQVLLAMNALNKKPGTFTSVMREISGGLGAMLDPLRRSPTPLEANQQAGRAEQAGPVPRALAEIAAFVFGPGKLGARAGAQAARVAPLAAREAVATAGSRTGMALAGAAVGARNAEGTAGDKVQAGLISFGLARLAPAMSDRIQGHLAGLAPAIRAPMAQRMFERSGVFFSEGVADALIGAGIRGGDFSNAMFDFLFGGAVGTTFQRGRFSKEAVDQFVERQKAKISATDPGFVEPFTSGNGSKPSASTLRQRQRGSVDASIGEDVAELIGVVSAPFREMKNELSRHGASGTEVGQRMDQGIEFSSEYRGKVFDAYDRALVATNGTVLPSAQGRAVRALQVPIKDPKTGVLLDPMTEMIEGRMKPRTKAEAKIIDSIRAYEEASWAEKHRIGMERQVASPDVEFKAGDEAVPGKDRVQWERIPKAPPNAHPRMFTYGVFSAFQGGQPKLRQKIISAVAKLNGWEKKQADAWGRRMDEAFQNDGPEGVEMRAQAEFTRDVQRMPGAVRHRGQIVPILRSNPHGWLKRFHTVSASAYGRRLAFGQGSTDSIPELQKNFRTENGSGKDRVFREAMRAYQETPVVRPVATKGSVTGDVLRTGKALLNVARAGRLSGAMPGNAVEILVGAQNAFGRFGDTMRGLLDLAIGKATGGKKGLTIRHLEEEGFKTKDVTDLTTDPNDPAVSGLNRFAAMMRSIVSMPLEEATETVTAARARTAAHRVQKNIEKGKFSARDLADARALGMSDGEASRWMKGDMTVEESKRVTDKFRRRMVTYTTAANQNSAQISRAEHTRFARGFMAFTRWASMRARISAKRVGLSARMIGEAAVGETSSGRTLRGTERAKHAYAGVERAAKHFFGVGVAGTASTLISSYLFEGEEGFEMRLNRLKNNPLEFFAEGVMAGSLSGPWAGLAQVMAGETDNFIERTIFPYQLGKNIWESVVGGGRQRGVPFWERMGQLGQTMFPISKTATTGALSSAFGRTDYQRTLKAATRGYFDMLRDEGVDFGNFKDPSDFSIKMRRAAKMIEQKEPASVWSKQVLDALGEEGKTVQQVKQSLRSRRRITGPSWTDDRIEQLRKIVGPDGIKALALRDLLLTTVADAL